MSDAGEEPTPETTEQPEETPAETPAEETAAEETPAEETPAEGAAEGEAPAEGEPAEGEAAPEEPKEPEPEPEPEKEPERLLETITAEQVAELASDSLKARWAEATGMADKTGYEQLGAEGFRAMLECNTPVDVMSFAAKTCRQLHAKYGKSRMLPQRIKWNKGAKHLFAWEKRMGGPRWDFPEGETGELDGPAEEIVQAFVAQSKEGRNKLSKDIEIDVPQNPVEGGEDIHIEKGTYVAIVTRVLKNRLKAKGLPDGSFEIVLKDDEYKQEEKNTFIVTTAVLDGTEEEVLKRAMDGMKLMVGTKRLVKDLKDAKKSAVEASSRELGIQQRVESLNALGAEVDAATGKPIASLRDASKGPLAELAKAIKALEATASDEEFAKKVAGAPGDGKQVELRKNLAHRLRVWLHAQHEDIDKMIITANDKLLSSSIDGGECAHSTESLDVAGKEGKKIPEFLENKNAVEVLEYMFKTGFDETMEGSDIKSTPAEDMETITWAVSL